ncbi:MAG: DNA-directed RNA polymerase subunit B'' [Candidatus Nanoarchaeia archaeon]|nr:DNA-directed RNA polymerase subunit B'' [Candidatus Nanoarchaeia archaeon]
MNKNDRIALINSYFKLHSIVDSDILSYNQFIEEGMQKIIDERKIIEPSVLPVDVDEFKIKFGKVKMSKPQVIEADGSTRAIYPNEVRLRNLSYTGRITVEVSSLLNGIQRDSFLADIGNFPVMLRSKYCHLNGLNEKELIDQGEDPYDTGGYFIINGVEKVIVKFEELAENNILIQEDSKGNKVAKTFSSSGQYKIVHSLEKDKEDVLKVRFSRYSFPVVLALKALGLTSDKDIAAFSSHNGQPMDIVVLNLYKFMDVKTQEEALERLSKDILTTATKEQKIEQIKEVLENVFYPHVNKQDKNDNLYKAYYLCKLVKKYLMVVEGFAPLDERDHYLHKRIKFSGDALEDLFRMSFNLLINDLNYSFQRSIKRGKIPKVRVLVRENLFSNKVMGAMSTGEWSPSRLGVAQRLQRINFSELISHLQRVSSSLSSSQTNFDARQFHPSHVGRLCPIETPEGPTIGLRKNMSMLAQVSLNSNNEELEDKLKDIGLRPISR